MTAKKSAAKIKPVEKQDKYVVDIFESELVPKHEILSPEEKEALLQKLGVNERKLPRILEKDPAAKRIGAKKGDVIRIIRKSTSAGVAEYYRYVV